MHTQKKKLKNIEAIQKAQQDAQNKRLREVIGFRNEPEQMMIVQKASMQSRL